METVDKDLVKELTAAKKAPRNFAVVVGGSECALVLAKGKVPPGKIKEAKEQIGGGRPLLGRCFMEEGVMVFELAAAPPGGLDKKIREAVKNNANMSLRVEVRQAEKGEKGDDDQADEVESQEATEQKTEEILPDLAGTFKERLKALTPAYQVTAKAMPAQKPVLDKIVTQAMTAAKGQDYQQGLAHLAHLEEAIKTAKQAGAAPDGQAAEFKTRLKGLTPPYQEASKTAPNEKPRFDKIVAGALAAAKAQNYVAALAQLDQLDAAIKTLKQAGTAPEGNAAFKDRLKALTTDYQAAAKAAPAQKAALDKLLAAALTAAKAQDYSQGMAHLDKLEAALKTATQTAAPGGSAAAFKDRFKALTPRFQEAVKLDAAAKPVLEKSLAQVMALAKALNFDQALRNLDKLEAVIKAVQARAAKQQQTAPTENETAEEETAENAEITAEVETLLKTLRPKLAKGLEAIRKSKPAEAAGLDVQFAKALGAHQAGNSAVAYDLLTTVDARLTTLLRTAKAAADIRKAAGPENVAFLVAKQEWDTSLQKARAGLAAFQQTVLNDPETQADPRYDDSIVPAVNELDKALAEVDDQRLHKAFDEAVSLPAAQKGAAIQKALNIIAEYRQKIDASDEIAAMDSGVYGSVNVGGSLRSALDAMTGRLNKRLKA